MAAKAYKNKAELLDKDYLLAEPFGTYAAVLGVTLMCNFHLFLFFLSNRDLQWQHKDERSPMMLHASSVHYTSKVMVLLRRRKRLNGTTGLFSDQLDGPVTFRSSSLSNLTLGVSVGYFIADLPMIFLFYPFLGGMEYVIHHMMSLISVLYAILSGKAQLYIYMGLMSEATTPGINLRWFLDTAGVKRSKAYVVNGVAIFDAWLVARIILFVYLFYHMFLHYDQIKQMDTFGCLLVSVVPTIILYGSPRF